MYEDVAIKGGKSTNLQTGWHVLQSANCEMGLNMLQTRKVRLLEGSLAKY